MHGAHHVRHAAGGVEHRALAQDEVDSSRGALTSYTQRVRNDLQAGGVYLCSAATPPVWPTGPARAATPLVDSVPMARTSA